MKKTILRVVVAIVAIAMVGFSAMPASAQSKKKMKSVIQEQNKVIADLKTNVAETKKDVEVLNQERNKNEKEINNLSQKIERVEDKLAAKEDTLAKVREDLTAEAEKKPKVIEAPLAKGEIRLNYENNTASYRKSEAEDMKDKVPTGFEAKEMPR